MVGYERLLNKSLHFTVSQFCLKFLGPKPQNFSNYQLSHSENYLLSLGLNFRPTPKAIPIHTLKKQIDEFSRSIRLKHYFCGRNLNTGLYHPKLFVHSNWNPPICPPYIEIPLLALRHELCGLKPFPHKPNLSHSELLTLSRLQANKTILVLPTDKNLGPAMVTADWYKRELDRLLNNEQFYKRVDEVPYTAIHDKLALILHRHGRSLGEKVVKYILQFVSNHSPAKFKVLPKVHKNPLVGRPIVASTKYITTPASRFVDCCLSPLLSGLPSYLKDSTQLINELANCNVSTDCFLVTADVTSLYTNIPIPDCLVAIDMFCRSNEVPITALITELSRLVLTNNFFEANGVLFHQLWGLAMGTPLAVSAAVIYMARLEQQILDTVGLVFYKRFIDDIFFIWEGNYIDLLDFISKLNNLAPTIKLTSSISQEKVVFLDMEVCHENGRLTTRPYQKPLNRYLYLPFTSYHPSHSKKSFIKAELLRYIRLSSKKSEFLHIKEKFFVRLRNRGYPIWFLKPIFEDVDYSSRDKLLQPHKRSTHVSRVFFKTYRNPLFSGVNLKDIILSNIGNEHCVTICFKGTPTLSKSVCRKFLGPPSQR